MKNVWLIVLLFSITGLYAQYPGENYAKFPGLTQEIEYLYSEENDTGGSLFIIRTSLSCVQIVIELTGENLKFPGKYEIYNILGRQLLNGQITEKTSTLSISALPKGIYILKVIIDKKQSSKKIIVK